MDTMVLLSVLVTLAAVPPSSDTSGTLPPNTTIAVYRPGWHGHRHCSTVAEGWLRGWADLTRATGWYNYLTSQAMIYQEQARAAAMANSKEAVATYFERRRMNHDARFGQKSAAYASHAKPASATSAAKPPRQLIDAATGKVAWPAGLADADLADIRSRIDLLVGASADASPAAAGHRTAELRRAVAEMQAELQAKISSLPPMEYVEAKRFLQALAADPSRGGVSTSGLLAGHP